eukprot:CAMPEP_0119124452 /NCGR_PEP_ID=MMETSP1310-20130426/4077_1 /TAXON_ID=464262 /ORGANISM="Genus nov. species nov., Strain RCC2339" /LENGTH=245 /DNA_ID=CAMNT_0007114407 /DNA_START=49 /DNA_END=782 /DNA_ORIENTATION=+
MVKTKLYPVKFFQFPSQQCVWCLDAVRVQCKEWGEHGANRICVVEEILSKANSPEDYSVENVTLTVRLMMDERDRRNSSCRQRTPFELFWSTDVRQVAGTNVKGRVPLVYLVGPPKCVAMYDTKIQLVNRSHYFCSYALVGGKKFRLDTKLLRKVPFPTDRAEAKKMHATLERFLVNLGLRPGDVALGRHRALYFKINVKEPTFQKWVAPDHPPPPVKKVGRQKKAVVPRNDAQKKGPAKSTKGP